MRQSCSICLETVDISLWKFIPCGHGYCSDCIESHVRTQTSRLTNHRTRSIKIKCPHCRKTFSPADPHPIFFDVVASSTQSQATAGETSVAQVHQYPEHARKHARFVTNKLAELDATSPAESIRRTAKEIRKVVAGSETSARDPVITLLSALPEWIDRVIIPQYTLLSSHSQQIESLKVRLSDSEDSRATAEAEAKYANDTASKAVAATEQAKEEHDRILTRLREVLQENQELKRDVGRVGLELMDKKTTDETQRKKISKLKLEIDNLKNQIQQVEGSKEELRISNARLESQLEQQHEELQQQRDPELSSDSGWDHYYEGIDLDADANDDDDNSGSFNLNLSSPFKSSASNPSLQIPSSDNPGIPPRKPKFPSTWTLSSMPNRKRPRGQFVPPKNILNPTAELFNETLGLDRSGRPSKHARGSLQLGDRRTLKRFGA